jgi:hypothetical protein
VRGANDFSQVESARSRALQNGGQSLRKPWPNLGTTLALEAGDHVRQTSATRNVIGAGCVSKGTKREHSGPKVKQGQKASEPYIGANGGYSYVALFYPNNRLYQVEGKALVAGGQAEVNATACWGRCSPAEANNTAGRQAAFISLHANEREVHEPGLR